MQWAAASNSGPPSSLPCHPLMPSPPILPLPQATLSSLTTAFCSSLSHFLHHSPAWHHTAAWQHQHGMAAASTWCRWRCHYIVLTKTYSFCFIFAITLLAGSLLDFSLDHCVQSFAGSWTPLIYIVILTAPSVISWKCLENILWLDSFYFSLKNSFKNKYFSS